MSAFSYSIVKPLLAEADQQGETLRCVFECPDGGSRVEASAPLIQGISLDQEQPEGGLFSRLRHALAGLLQGSIGAEACAASATPGGEPISFSAGERRAAVVAAFRSVSHEFIFLGERWVSLDQAEDLLSPFELQLRLAPIRSVADQRLLARMLIEAAQADGRLTSTEWRFLGELVPRELGSIESMMGISPLEAADLQGSTRGAVRDTLLMLTCALALIDSEADAAEDIRLASFGGALRIPPQRVEELKGFAQRHLLEQALLDAEGGGSRAGAKREEARRLGQRLGLTPEAVQQVEERLRRRRGAT